MREIKFRAWYKEEKQMFDYPNNDFEMYGFDDSRIEVMQFTGLLDRNGNKIFEGDVVNSKANHSSSEIKFGEYRFWENHDYSETIGFYFHEGVDADTGVDLGEHLGDQKAASTYYEVIGNIWEHPHLLEAK